MAAETRENRAGTIQSRGECALNIPSPDFRTAIGVCCTMLALVPTIPESSAQSPYSALPSRPVFRHHVGLLPKKRTGVPQAAAPQVLPPAGGSWQPVTTAPASLATPFLLTDGTVIAHDADTPYWYRLTPDINGSYANGTWSQIASLPAIGGTQYAPQYHASAVLPDGRVIVMGGEYNGSGTEVWTNLGAIYDPAVNTWTAVSAPPGWTRIGDAASVVLANGTFMLSSCCADPAADALLDAATLSWTATAGPAAGDSYQDEQGYEQLPNGDVLTLDVWTHYAGGNATNAEQYLASSGTWTAAGNTPASLVDPYQCGNWEIGPAALRPDGTVVAFGGNSGCSALVTALGAAAAADPTAIYDYLSNSWTAGPNVPAACTATTSYPTANCTLADAPAAVLPNGNILFAASSGYGQSPTHFFEFTKANAINQVADTVYYASSSSSFYYNFLVLPNGQVLSTDFSNVAEVYTPSGSANPNWAPVIASAPSSVAPGGTYAISGTQFNGLSQGAYYGDDAQTATNYPLVRIINSATGHVFYARTFNHGTMSVAPGAAGSTQFTVPATVESGASTLVVVANGIASQPAAVTVGAAPTYTLTPGSLPFGSVYEYEASGALVATVTNTGAAALPITSITLSGTNHTQFSKTTTCGTSLAPATACTVSVEFKPTATGAMTATLNVNAGGGAGKKTVALTGTGAAAPYTLSPRSLAFGSVPHGTASTVQPVTVTNTSAAAMPITSITLSGPNHTQFTKTKTCGASLAIGAQCTVNVKFAPTTTGAMKATLNIKAGGGDGTQTVAITGTGT